MRRWRSVRQDSASRRGRAVIVIIGAGLGGLSAALALSRAGHAVQVFERAPALTEVGAGISLWANAMRVLDALGVGEAVRKASEPLRTTEFRGRNGRSVVARFDAEVMEQRLGFSPVIAMIHRATLVEILASALPAGSLHFGAACEGVAQHPDRLAVSLSNGATVDADVVVASDGVRSRVRSIVFGDTAPRFAGYVCFRGVCARPAGLECGYLGEWWGRGQRFGITALPNDLVYWWATVNVERPDVTHDIDATLIHRFADWSAPVPSLLASTPRESILCHDVIDRPPTRGWSRDRVVMIGDAAHATTPNLGQGGCLAIEDSVVLARHLGNPGPIEARLRAFEQERFARTTAINRESYRLGAVGQWQGSVACGVRDQVARLVLRYAGIDQLLAHARYDALAATL